MPPRIVAFHFPQFHRIPENDLWWGKGYDEWVDVRRAVSRFAGHRQPRLPTELGFYNLSDSSVLERQSRMALAHGIYGFCFYYYWFQGKKLLERPIETMLRNPKVEIPFCICFANETWTRAWNGHREEILIRQEHSFADDRQFLRNLIPYFKDPRYIRISDRPLLLIYQTKLFSNPEKTAGIWRDEARRHGLSDLYLCRCESYFDFTDPTLIGFDAAYEFPPHCLKPVEREVRSIGDFDGSVFDYPSCVDASRQTDGSAAAYKRFRGVMTGFDNSPKMRTRSWVFLDSTPDLYRQWLMDAIADTVARHDVEEQIVFVNAWNEWGEGAILEPCSLFGDAYLKATAAAIHAG